MRLRTILRCYVAAVLLLPVALGSQARPSFEVASIRQSLGDRNNGTIRITGSQVRISEWPLKEYIALAYDVRPQQISGPDWLSEQAFDIAGTIPSGVSTALVPEMLQALLEDRLQLKLHRETRESVREGTVVCAPHASEPKPARSRIRARGGCATL